MSETTSCELVTIALHWLILLHEYLRILLENGVTHLIKAWHHIIALILHHSVSLSSHLWLKSSLVILLEVAGIGILVVALMTSVELLLLACLHLHISVDLLLLGACVDLSATTKAWELIRIKVGRTLIAAEDLIVVVLHFSLSFPATSQR